MANISELTWFQVESIRREGFEMALGLLRRRDARIRVSPHVLADDLERQAPGVIAMTPAEVEALPDV